MMRITMMMMAMIIMITMIIRMRKRTIMMTI